MKKQLLSGLLGLFLCSVATPEAADYCQNYDNCCEWNMCDGKFNVGADWLYWKTEQDNMLIGTIVDGNFGNGKEARVFEGHNKRPNYKFDNGFRVWAGYQLPCDCWDVGVSYTYLPSSANIVSFHSDDVIDSNGGRNGDTVEFFSTYLSDFVLIRDVDGLNGNLYTDYHSKWNSTLNYIDVDVARTICLCECFKFRPHVGFRAAWMDQKLRTLGSLPIPAEGEQPESTFATLSLQKQKFKGYGIEGGLWGEWDIGCGLSLIGHVGGSVLYSKFSVNQQYASVTYIDINQDPELNFAVDLHDSFWTATPTVDYFLGLNYANCFCDMIFNIHAGWEQHVFFDMNRLSCNGGNLSTQGLTVGVDVGF